MVEQPKASKTERWKMNTAESSPSLTRAHDLILEVIGETITRPMEKQPLAEIPGWDSVVMVRLVVALEQRLGRQLDDAELERIETFGDIEDLLKSPPAV